MRSDTIVSIGVWFKNFLSFGDKLQYIDLSGENLSIILGENFDMGGEDSRNGVGKSAIIDAISYALFGKSIRGVSGPKLVNKTMGRNMLVCYEFIRGDYHYRIERGLGPDRLNFFRKPVGNSDAWNIKGPDRQPVYDITEKRKDDTNLAIEQAFILSSELFEMMMVNSSETTPFLKMKEEDKRKIVENLIGITILSEKAKILGKQRLEEKKRLAGLESALASTIQANKRVQDQIDHMEHRSADWERSKSEVIQELNATIREIETIDIDSTIEALTAIDELRAELLLAQNEKRIYDTLVKAAHDKRAQHAQMVTQAKRMREDQRKSLERQYAEADIIARKNELAILDTDIKTAQTLVDNTIRDGIEIADKLHQVRNVLDGVNQNICTQCLQPWVVDHSHKKQYEDEIALLEKQSTDIATKLKSCKKVLAKLENQRTKLATSPLPESKKVEESDLPPLTIPDISEEETELPEDPTERIKELQETLKEFADIGLAFKTLSEATRAQVQLEEARQQLLEKNIQDNPFTTSIHKLKTEALKVIDYTEIEELKSLIEHYDLLINLLTSNDSFIRKAIIDKYLPILNGKITKYLKILELPHRVRFNPDMTVEIRLYQEEYEYGNLSKGERLRLTLALNFAFQDLYETMYHKLSMLLVDELLDNGICARGAENGMSILQRMTQEKHKRVILITHREDIASRVDDVIRVRKENGFSSIVERK